MVDHCKESADQRSARIEARLAEALRKIEELEKEHADRNKVLGEG